jgi:4-amino-4-deoxy-L-arabinose transferase-like glycosyltransferase
MKIYKKLTAILILGLAFRLFLMNWRFAIGFDEPHYLQLGASAALFGWKNILHPYWPPMYPALVALLSVFSHDFELVGRLVSAITGTAVAVPVYVLAKELYGARAGLLAALLFALFPATAFDDTSALSESAYTFLSISGVAVGWFALKKRSVWKGALAGTLFGLSYLTKPEGVGYLLVYLSVAGIWLLYDWRQHRRLATAKIMLVATAMALFVASPYILYLRQLTGEWIISGKYKVNRFDLPSINRLLPDNQNSPLDMAYHFGTFHEYDANTYTGSDGSDRNLGELAKRMAENVYKLLRYAIPGVITGPMFFLMALGLMAGRWTWPQIQLNLYLFSFIAFFWLIVIAFFHITERYLSPLLPLCFAWIGQGTVVLYKRVQHFFRLLPMRIFSSARCGLALTAGLLFVFSFLPELGRVVGRSSLSREVWADAVELKQAGNWLKANTNTPPTLMSYNKAVDFYAGQFDIRKTATFSYDSLDRILDYAARRSVNYLVIDERYQDEFPNLSFLLQPESAPEELKPVYEKAGAAGLRVVIYQLQTSEPGSE